MPTIPPRFTSVLSPTSAGGHKATADELAQALDGAPVDEVQAFAARGIDACADTEAIRRVAERVGLDALPVQLGRLEDHPAGRAWKNGDFALERHVTGPAREAVVLLQRALLKIGAHHPDGAALTALLQLPYGADGDLGPLTRQALNTAMAMAGRPDLAMHTADTPVTSEVAHVLETLLSQTPALIHPTLLNAPPSTPPAPPVDTAPPGPSLDRLFGGVALRLSANTMGKWADVVPRIDAEVHRYDGGAGDDLPPAAVYWQQHLDGIAGETRAFQLNSVNALVNGWLYASDDVTWGQADKWATPLEFLAEQRGDCEDYVICKYESLRRLGVPEDDMRLVTVEDMAAGGLAHMVLVVEHEGQLHVLDNQHRMVVPPDELTLPDGSPRYRPIYSMNRNGTWVFGNPVSAPPA